jgi:hypothetical protein
LFSEPLVVVLAGLDGRHRYMTDDPLIVEVVRNLMKSGLEQVEPSRRVELDAVPA